MSGPNKSAERVSAIDKVLAAWTDPPHWVVKLAEAVDAPGSSQAAVGRRVGYDGSTISQVLSNTYGADLARVEQSVRGALMAETLVCPVVGEIKRNICLGHQKRARRFVPSSGMRVQLYNACRKTCEHSQIRGGAHVE